jgi:hypothetical protein
VKKTFDSVFLYSHSPCLVHDVDGGAGIKALSALNPIPRTLHVLISKRDAAANCAQALLGIKPLVSRDVLF